MVSWRTPQVDQLGLGNLAHHDDRFDADGPRRTLFDRRAWLGLAGVADRVFAVVDPT